MSDIVGALSGRSQLDHEPVAPSRSPARCVHMPEATAGLCGCGRTWCDTPWSSSRMGCPWYDARTA